MAYPVGFTVSYSYTSFAQGLGDGSFPGTQLDADLADFSASLAATIAFLEGITKSDGTLKNGIVTADALDAPLAAALGDLTSLATFQALADAAAASETAAGTSETNAAASAAAAGTSETNAAASETAAAASATAADTSETNAAASETAAAASATAADTSETNAAASETAAAASATAADTSETNAAASETAAAASATAAGTSETNAAASETAAAASATAAGTSETNAAASETAAEAARDQALATNNIYPDTTTALAAVGEGDYFIVPVDGVVVLYRKVSAAAVEQARYASGTFTGPASSVDGNIVVFDGIGGDTGKDSGIAITDASPASAIASKFRALGLFHPTFLFGSSDTGDCWDVWDPSTLFQNSTKTTAVTASSDPCGAIVGQHNSTSLIQATSTKRPTFTISGGLRYLLFDGSDDYLSATYTQNGVFTRISLIKQVAWTAVRYIFDDPAGRTTAALMQDPTTPSMRMRNSSNLIANANLSVGDFGVVTEVWNGASSKFTVNNGTAVTGTTGTVSRTGLVVGNSGDLSTLNANFAVVSFIDIGRILTDAEIAKVRTFYGARVGLNL